MKLHNPQSLSTRYRPSLRLVAAVTKRRQRSILFPCCIATFLGGFLATEAHFGAFRRDGSEARPAAAAPKLEVPQFRNGPMATPGPKLGKLIIWL